MNARREQEISQKVTKAARILDVGGAHSLSRFATHVIDLQAHPGPESSIHPDNWVVQDICGDKPFPWPENFFDFVICSHTLEDVRDPLRVCRELSRVGLAGYVETPSPLFELTRGIESQGLRWVGCYHHRWLVDLDSAGLVFIFKPHFLVASRRFHFPARYGAKWRDTDAGITSYFWDGQILARERVILNREEFKSFIESIVGSVRGEILSMRLDPVRKYTWRIGVDIAERLGIRKCFRPLAQRIRRWV